MSSWWRRAAAQVRVGGVAQAQAQTSARSVTRRSRWGPAGELSSGGTTTTTANSAENSSSEAVGVTQTISSNMKIAIKDVNKEMSGIEISRRKYFKMTSLEMPLMFW